MTSIRLWLAAAIALTLAGAACSSDDDGDGDSVNSPSEPTGDVVDIAPADPEAAGDFIEGMRVDIGQTGDADGLLLTVESIRAGTEEPDPASGAASTIDVQASVENSTDAELAGPDVYAVCATDGRVAIALDSSEIEYLVPLDPGESTSGRYVVGVPDDCDEVLMQARVLATDTGPDRIAEWAVPADALA